MLTRDPIKLFDFKPLPIEIEVKNLKFIKEIPNLLGRPHKVTFYHIIRLETGTARFTIDFREINMQAGDCLIISAGQVCQFDTESEYTGKAILFTGSFFFGNRSRREFPLYSRNP